jgi:hypothetical protein
MKPSSDLSILRDLASRYAEAAVQPVQEERRALWRAHMSLKPTRPPVLFTYGMWNVWCREIFGDDQLQCQDAFFREQEQNLRLLLFHDTIGDDFILEPWLTLRAAVITPSNGLWGVKEARIGEENYIKGGSYKPNPPLKSWKDMHRLVKPSHRIDEAETTHRLERMQEAIGDILTINLDRSPAYLNFDGDISTTLAALRGLEQIMYDMSDYPQQLHALLAFLRDGILATHQQAERAGDWNLAVQKNQVMCYCEELEDPRANAFGHRRSEMWCHLAAQEYVLVSPRMHEEFLLRYQMPIMEQFGLVAYGCCENLTSKIKMLRQIKNLRSIAIAPSANVANCAEQMGTDYVFSWRPNPAQMVCVGFDETNIRRILQNGLEESRGCRVHILLKDVETVEGDLSRLSRWVQIAREVAEQF